MVSVSLAFATLAGISKENKITLPEIGKLITVAPFDQLTIDGNFKLMLVENDEPAVSIKGNTRFVKAFKVYQDRDGLIIRSLYGEGKKDENQVVINVKNLRSLRVRKNAVITTPGILQSAKLNIIVDSECFVSVTNTGETNIRSSDNYELNISCK